MCKAFEDNRKEGIEEGKKQGKIEGKREGKREGRKEGRSLEKARMARELILSGKLSEQEIARITELSLVQIRTIKTRRRQKRISTC